LPNAPKKLTYNIADDGSIVLRTLKGADSRTLKKMSDQELRQYGLTKTLIGDKEKFFPI